MKVGVKYEDDIGLVDLIEKAENNVGHINNGIKILPHKIKEYIIPKDDLVYKFYAIEIDEKNNLEEYGIGKVYFDSVFNDWVLSMNTWEIEKEYIKVPLHLTEDIRYLATAHIQKTHISELISLMKNGRYLVTAINNKGFGVVIESPSGEINFYKLYDNSTPHTAFAIKETDEGIAVIKISGRVKIRRKTKYGIEEEYLI